MFAVNVTQQRQRFMQQNEQLQMTRTPQSRTLRNENFKSNSEKILLKIINDDKVELP